MPTRRSFVWFTELLLLAACATTPPPPSPALHLTPCTIAGAAARCGTFEVAEGPASARTLALNVIVLPAMERNEAAIFPFNGGPGEPVTAGAEMEVTLFAGERRLHDVVLVDERGTGGSAPLVCPEALKSHDRELIEDDILPPPFVADCRREIEANTSPAFYTFDYFADDVEHLRKALGYGRIDIVGLSYGTRAALTFLDRHPSAVRSMLLLGPLSPENAMPLEAARDAQASLDRLIADCAADAVCAATFPRFEAELEEVMAWLGTHAPEIRSGDYTLRLSRGGFAEYLRSMLYTAERQRSVPLLVHLAATGKWDELAPRIIRYRKGWYENVGAFLAVTCPTDVRRIHAADATAATANTFLGDYRVARQMAACEAWTPGSVPPLHVSTAEVPVLMVTGDFDPVTPPRWAERLSRQLRRSRTIVLRNSGHVDGGDCAVALEVAFFDAGSFEKLDDSCARSLKRPPFATAPE